MIRFFTTIIFLIPFFHLFGQEAKEYRPLLEKGKEWKVRYDCDNDSLPSYFVTYSITGDTVIDDTTVWMMEEIKENNSSHNIHYLKEEDQKIYFLYSKSKFYPLLDFSGKAGERTIDIIADRYPQTGWLISKEGYMEIQGIERRYLKFAAFSDGYEWIEGIGAPKFNFLTVFSVPGCDTAIYTRTLESCTLNDTLIFCAEDMSKFMSGITDTKGSKTSRSELLYDLNGTAHKNPETRGIYIRNGKKIIFTQ